MSTLFCCCIPVRVEAVNALRIGHLQDMLQLGYDIVIYALTLRWHTYEAFSGFMFIPVAVILALISGGLVLGRHLWHSLKNQSAYMNNSTRYNSVRV